MLNGDSGRSVGANFKARLPSIRSDLFGEEASRAAKHDLADGTPQVEDRNIAEDGDPDSDPVVMGAFLSDAAWRPNAGISRFSRSWSAFSILAVTEVTGRRPVRYPSVPTRRR
jgi:hypothetical protein